MLDLVVSFMSQTDSIFVQIFISVWAVGRWPQKYKCELIMVWKPMWIQSDGSVLNCNFACILQRLTFIFVINSKSVQEDSYNLIPVAHRVKQKTKTINHHIAQCSNCTMFI